MAPRTFAPLLAAAMLGACAQTEYEVGVHKPFRVVSFEPAGGAEAVPLVSSMRVTFSDDLLASTLDPTTVFLLDTTTSRPVPATLAYADGTEPFTVTLTPTPGLDPDPTPDVAGDDPLAFSRRYELHVTTGLRREAVPDRPLEQIDEIGLAEEAISGFWTEDPPPLAVVASAPESNSTAASRTTDLRVTFSESVRPESVTAASFAVTDVTDYDPRGAVVGTLSFADSDPTQPLRRGDIVVLTPASELGWSRDLEIDLGTELASARATDRGGTLPAPVTLRFSTEDPPPLALVASTPASGAVDVPVDAAVTLDFDATLDLATLPPIADTIAVETVGATGNELVDGTWMVTTTGSASHDRLVFTPAAPLPWSATVAVTLTTDLQSAIATPRGGQLASAVTLTFDVVPPPPLALVAATPAPGSHNADPRTVITLGFDRSLDPATVSTASVVVTDLEGGEGVAGAIAVDGATVVFTPAADLALDARIGVSLTTDLRADPALGGGALAEPLAYAFHTAPAPPLEVVAWTPGELEQPASIAVAPSVTFSTSVYEPTLPTGGIDSSTTGVNFFVGECPESGTCDCASAARLPGVVSYDPEARTAVFAPSAPLAGSSTYVVCVLTGAVSLGGGTLSAPFAATFVTESANQIASTSPARGEQAVSATRRVRLTLREANVLTAADEASLVYGSSVRVTYVDPFGREALVPADVAVQSTVLPHYIELVPRLDLQPCLTAAHLWRYSTQYTVTLTEAVTTNGGTLPLTGGVSFSFTTATEPEVVLTYPDAGAEQFSVVAPLLATLSGPVEPATLRFTPVAPDEANDTVLLHDGGAYVALAAVTVDAHDPTTVVVVPDAALLANGHLAYDTEYTLTLRGGPGASPPASIGVSLAGANGGANYLGADFVLAFRTLPPLAVTMLPLPGTTGEATNSSVALTFSRPVDVTMLTESRFKVVDCGTTACATVDPATPSLGGLRSYTDDRSTAVFIPIPELAPVHDFRVALVGDAAVSRLTDAFGNPMDADFVGDFTTAGGPNHSAPVLTLTSPLPGAVVRGDTAVVVTSNKQLHPDGLTCEGFWVAKDLGGTLGANLCRAVSYDASTMAVRIAVVDAAADLYLESGATYHVGFTHRVGDLQFNAGVPVELGTFGIETTAPALVSTAPADAATGVAVDAPVTATFSEPLRLASLDATSSFVLATGETTVTGAFTVSGDTVAFTPSAPLKGATEHVLTIGGGTVPPTDLGGVPLAAVAVVRFTTEATPPTVESAAFAGDGLALVFSEPMDVASVTTSTATTAGALQLFSGTCAAPGAEVMLCASWDPTLATAALRPCPLADDAAATLPSGAYCLRVGTAATDRGGLPLATAHEQDLARP